MSSRDRYQPSPQVIRMNQSSSSLSLDDDQFDILQKQNQRQQGRQRPPQAQSKHSHPGGARRNRPVPEQHNKTPPKKMTAGTPMMKTPTMDSLTRKYEFLLGHDVASEEEDDDDTSLQNQDNDHQEEGSHESDDAYFRTPSAPPASAASLKWKLEQRTLSYGSHSVQSQQQPNHTSVAKSHSGRNKDVASRGSSPARSMASQAQSILEKLDDHLENGSVGSRSLESRSSSLMRRQSSLKQNLEERLHALEVDPHPVAAMTPPHIRQASPASDQQPLELSSPFRSPYQQQPIHHQLLGSRHSRSNSHGSYYTNQSQQGSATSRSRHNTPGRPQQLAVQQTPPRLRKTSPFHRAFANIKHTYSQQKANSPMLSTSASTDGAHHHQHQRNLSATTTTPIVTTQSLPTNHWVVDVRDYEPQKQLSPPHKQDPPTQTKAPVQQQSPKTSSHDGESLGKNGDDDATTTKQSPKDRLSFPMSKTTPSSRAEMVSPTESPTISASPSPLQTQPLVIRTTPNNHSNSNTPVSKGTTSASFDTPGSIIRGTPVSIDTKSMTHTDAVSHMNNNISPVKQSQHPQHYEEDTASFWHRWKMAECRLQQQQEQFEAEKHDWVQQLDNAYQANAHVEALAKRMEVQLLAVHKTCLEQEGGGDSDMDEDAVGIMDMDVGSQGGDNEDERLPIDPLHLLMLKESSVADELKSLQQEQLTESKEGKVRELTNAHPGTSMDSFEYTEKLERRMARTRTKNVILAHLVKLLERQGAERTLELQEQLQTEKDERRELSQHMRELERKLDVQQSQPQPSTPSEELSGPFDSSSSGLISPRTSTGSDQHKALQQRLWMREQQYEHERKEYESKIKALEADRAVQSIEAQASKDAPDSADRGDGNINHTEALQSELEAIFTEKEELQAKFERQQADSDRLQEQLSAAAREHDAVLLKQQEELERSEKQLTTALEDLEDMSEHAKAMDLKVERLESKHSRERKQWEWSLLQQGKRADSTSHTGKLSSSYDGTKLEQLAKERELERSRWEEELQSAYAEVERLELEVERNERNPEDKSSQETIQLLERDQIELKQQSDIARGECEEKSRQIADLQSWLEESNEEVLRLQRQGVTKKEIVDAVNEKDIARKYQEEISNLELSLQIERKSNKESQDELSRLENEMLQLKATHEGEIHVLKQRTEATVNLPDTAGEAEDLGSALHLAHQNTKKAKDESTRLEDSIVELQAAHQRAIHNLKQRIQAAESPGKVNETLADLGPGLHEIYNQDLEAKVQAVSEELEQCQHTLQAQSAKCKEAMERNGGLELEIELLERRCKEEEADLTSLVDSLQEQKTSHAESQMCVNDLSAKVEDLETALRETKVDLLATANALEAEMFKSKEILKANVALEKQLQDSDVAHSRQMVVLDAQPKSLQNGNQTMIQFSLEEKIVNLEAKEQLLKTELDRLESENRLSEECNAKLNTELAQLNDRFIQEMKEMKARFQSLHSDNDGAFSDIAEENKLLSRRVEQLQEELVIKDSSHNKLIEERNSLNSELEKSNSILECRIKQLEEELGSKEDIHKKSLDLNLQQLNERFLEQMKDLEIRYQNLQVDSAATQNDLLEKNSSLEKQLRGLQAELSTANETVGAMRQSSIASAADAAAVEARAEQLQKELWDATSEARGAKDKSAELASEAEELRVALAKERNENQSQKHQLDACESSDSVRTQELIEESAERERQLEEAKRELRVGLDALQAESEKYRAVVENNIFLDKENKELRLEKKEWESHVQALRDESMRQNTSIAAKNSDLLQQLQDLEIIHEKTIRDTQLASRQEHDESEKHEKQLAQILQGKSMLQSQLADAQQQIEVSQALHDKNLEEHEQHLNQILKEKSSVQSQLTDAQQQLEVNKALHEETKIQRVEQAPHASLETCTQALGELQQELREMGEQVFASNQTAVKELTNQRGQEGLLLEGFARIQQDMEEAVSKIVEEARTMGPNQEVFVRHLVGIETSLEKIPTQQGFSSDMMKEHRALLERLRDTCLRSETLASSRADETLAQEAHCNEIAEYKSKLAVSKAKLQQVARDLEIEVGKRKAAEKKLAAFNNLQTSNDSKARSEPPVNHWDGNQDLDAQIARLGAQIESEMREIRKIDIREEESRAMVVVTGESDDISCARQAMTAQTLLLVQSLRDLIFHDSSDSVSEDPPAEVMHHLEILSELMGEVDMLESAAAPSSESIEILQLEGQKGPEASAMVLFRESSLDTAPENELLRFELAQDETFDLLDDDASQDLSPLLEHIKGASSPKSDAIIPVASETQEDPSRSFSPVELVVEQTYNRCQVLERERCDLINVTLDLLSSVRDANKAEIDAALASCRRKASEEMLAMKRETQAQADQIWWMLCDKCRHCLTQG